MVGLEEKQARIDAIKAKLTAREGRPGTASNCEEIQAKIVRLEQDIADGL